jgi:hypothetical protein
MATTILLLDSESIATDEATTVNITPTCGLANSLLVVAKAAFGAGDKALKLALQGSFDDDVWFSFTAQDLTSATLAYTNQLTLAGDVAASVLLYKGCIAPYMRIQIDNTGSAAATTLTLGVCGV